MRLVRVRAFALLISCTVPVVALAQSVQPNTSWKNQRGSTFEITKIGDDGALEGTYVNNAAGFKCQGTPYKVTGWVYDNRVAFAVRWKNATEDCASITAWTGYLDGAQLTTDWNLVYIDGQSHQPAIETGKDMFTKQ